MARENYIGIDPGKKGFACIYNGYGYEHYPLFTTQKPVELIRWLIRSYSNEGDTILDNCMGSGTTAIACIREKRNFIGFELNPEYYEVCKKRIINEDYNLFR